MEAQMEGLCTGSVGFGNRASGTVCGMVEWARVDRHPAGPERSGSITF